MKEAVTKGIDTLTQKDFYGALQKLLERYNKCIAARGDYFEGDWSFMCVLSIKVHIRKKSGNLFNDPRIDTIIPNSTKDFYKDYLLQPLMLTVMSWLLPWRHIAALRVLSRNNIISSDKGGGVIILDSTQYNNKIMELSSNKNTHEQISLQNCLPFQNP